MSPSCRHLGPFSSRLFTIGFGFSMGSSANQEVRTTSYSTFRGISSVILSSETV